MEPNVDRCRPDERCRCPVSENYCLNYQELTMYRHGASYLRYISSKPSLLYFISNWASHITCFASSLRPYYSSQALSTSLPAVASRNLEKGITGLRSVIPPQMKSQCD